MMLLASPLQIAKNDPALAHACARQLRELLDPYTGGVVRALGRCDLKRGRELLRKKLGPLVIGEEIHGKDIGSRARGCFVLLVSHDDGFLGLVGIEYRAKATPRWNAFGLHVRVSKHAVARVLQRSVGVAELRLVALLLRKHLLGALDTLRELGDRAPPCRRLVSADHHGIALWAYDDDGNIELRTWLDHDGARPTWARMIDQAGGGVVAQWR